MMRNNEKATTKAVIHGYGSNATACPTCGQAATSPVTIACSEMRQAADKLTEAMRKFDEEMREIRREQQRERENPPIGKRVNWHWGRHRQQRPAWQQDPVFLKQTMRPRR